MGGNDLLWLDGTGQADLIRRGEVSATELVDAAIEKLERVDGDHAVLVHERYAAARSEAADCDTSAPFAGVPMLLKDLIAHSAGDPFHEAVAGVARRAHVEADDTELVTRFRAAGLVVLGRSKCSELGVLPTAEPVLYDPARNPWDPERATMGSSGGSAAAVAAGAVAVGHGNDLGGSLRAPASACGIVGFKPSRARVSLAPDFGDLVSGFVTEFAMTRSVRDAARLLDAVEGAAPGDPYDVTGPTDFAGALEADPEPLRIGLHPAAGDEACSAAVHATGRVLEDLGHHVEEAHPEALDEGELGLHLFGIITAFAEYALSWWQRRLGEPLGAGDVEPFTWWLAEQSRSRTPADYLSTIEWLQAWSRRMTSWWTGGFDVLVTPTMSAPPPPLGTFRYDPDNPVQVLLDVSAQTPHTMASNITGAPAVSLPLGTAGHLPVGVQLVGLRGLDRALLALSAQLERSLPWSDRRPPGW